MDYKYRSLLQNIPVRHLINKMKGPSEIGMHLNRLMDVDLNNIFLFMSSENAAMYLKEASQMGMHGTKYSWFVLTLVIIIQWQSITEIFNRFDFE